VVMPPIPRPINKCERQNIRCGARTRGSESNHSMIHSEPGIVTSPETNEGEPNRAAGGARNARRPDARGGARATSIWP
jgi:hypothetical protein